MWIPRDVVARSIEHSFCFGLYNRDGQIGFARVVTDYSSMAHLMDVFVLPAYRGGDWGCGSYSASSNVPPCRACAA